MIRKIVKIESAACAIGRFSREGYHRSWVDSSSERRKESRGRLETDGVLDTLTGGEG